VSLRKHLVVQRLDGGWVKHASNQAFTLALFMISDAVSDAPRIVNSNHDICAGCTTMLRHLWQGKRGERQYGCQKLGQDLRSETADRRM
jgi:hypothetical protein